MRLFFALLVAVNANANSPVEPLYQDVKKAEDNWKACYDKQGRAFQNCIDRVGDEAQIWYLEKSEEVREMVGRRPKPKPKLDAFDKIEYAYKPFQDTQCAFEAYTRSGEQSEIDLQSSRCRFRRGYDSMIHIFEALNLFGKGLKIYDGSFLPPPPVRPEFKNAVEGEMYATTQKSDTCYQTAGANTDERLRCMKASVAEMNAYLNTRLETWYPILRAGPRGEIRYKLLVETHKRWTLFRRDFCNFVAEYYNDTPKEDKNMPAMQGLLCVHRATVARVREMFQLR